MIYGVSFLKDLLDHLSSYEWILLANIVAIMLSQDLNFSEVGILANFFSALGDNLNIIASGKSSDNIPKITL